MWTLLGSKTGGQVLGPEAPTTSALLAVGGAATTAGMAAVGVTMDGGAPQKARIGTWL